MKRQKHHYLKHSRLYWGIIASLILPFCVEASPRIEIQKFRFGRHKPYDFERLVLQFKSKDTSSTDPFVRISPHESRQQATIYLDKASLSGAIPESSINDSYIGRSRYLGPISINNDDPSQAISFRVFLKDNQLNLDAFWLSNPGRLVVDAFPKTSPRASKGRDVSRYRKRNPSSLRARSPVICFPASAQVMASVQFHAGPNGGPEYNLGTGGPNTNGPIVCYPRRSEVMANIRFQPGFGYPWMGMGMPYGGGAGANNNSVTKPRLSLAPRPSGIPSRPGTPPGLGRRAPSSITNPGRAGLPTLPSGPKLPGGRAGGSTLNGGGFSPVTPLGAKLGPGGPQVPPPNPNSLLLPGKR